MKIQNKLARYINNTTVSNKEVQVNKMVKAIALAERELEQARALFADFVSTPMVAQPVAKTVKTVKEVKQVKKVEQVKVIEQPKAKVEPAPLIITPVMEQVIRQYKGLDLTPAPVVETPAPPAKSEYKGLDLGTPLVEEVKQQMKKPVTKASSVNKRAAFVFGPASPAMILNSARPSHKHNSLEYMAKLQKFIYTGIMKLARAGIREIRVAELEGVELLTALIWKDVLVKFPDMELVLYSNGRTDFKAYKTQAYEEAFAIYSPYRLQQQLRQLATRTVMVKGKAFDIRRAVVKDAYGYVRVQPFGKTDVTTPLFKGVALAVNICPWTLAVELGGELPAASIPGDGGDYRPLKLIAEDKATPVVSDTPVYKGLTLS